MKPATVALLSFLLSLGIYSLTGFQLALASEYGSQVTLANSTAIEIVASIILAILTALFVFKIEKG